VRGQGESLPKVRDPYGRTIAMWPVGSVATGGRQTCQTNITLGRGAYTLEFDAVDLAGNNQAIPGLAALIVY